MEHRTQATPLDRPAGIIHDTECEAAVLSTILANHRALDAVRDILSDECFLHPAYIAIWKAIRSAESHGITPDFINVPAELAKAGENYYDEFVSLTGGYHDTDCTDYAYRLKELAIRRRLWQLSEYLRAVGETETTDTADAIEHVNAEMQAIVGEATSDVTTLEEEGRKLIALMERNAKGDPGILGTPTGFDEIDRRGGLVPGELIVVAAETSQGKTSFATAMAVSAIKAAHPVAIYSMEMTSPQLTGRVAAMESGVGSRRIMQEQLDDATRAAVGRAITSLPGRYCYFDDTATSNIDKILASIRTQHKRHGIKGAIVDYLQILNVNQKVTNKEQAMGDVARRLKNIAKELGIWVVAISQLNRESGATLPTLSRLRDSGQIGEAADTIMLLYRPSEGRAYPGEFKEYSTTGTAMVDVAKGRNVGIYRFICGFDTSTTRFYNIPQATLKKRGDPDAPGWVRDKQQSGNPDELPF